MTIGLDFLRYRLEGGLHIVLGDFAVDTPGERVILVNINESSILKPPPRV